MFTSSLYVCLFFNKADLVCLSIYENVYKNHFILPGLSAINVLCWKADRWDGSIDNPKHMLKLMGKKISTILRSKFCSSKPMVD